jgi:hypothetical protein
VPILIFNFEHGSEEKCQAELHVRRFWRDLWIKVDGEIVRRDLRAFYGDRVALAIGGLLLSISLYHHLISKIVLYDIAMALYHHLISKIVLYDIAMSLVAILVIPLLLIDYFLIKDRSFTLAVGQNEKHVAEITSIFRMWWKTRYIVVVDGQKKVEIKDRQIEEWNLNEFSVLEYEI